MDEVVVLDYFVALLLVITHWVKYRFKCYSIDIYILMNKKCGCLRVDIKIQQDLPNAVSPAVYVIMFRFIAEKPTYPFYYSGNPMGKHLHFF